MKSFSAEAMINAPAETVWSLLTNASSYPEWDPNIISIEGNTLKFEARVANGELYDAFTLQKQTGKFNALTDLVPATPEIRKPQEIDYRALHRDGRVRHLREVIHLSYDETGHAVEERGVRIVLEPTEALS